MRPFDLEEALSGKAVLLRNGDKASVRHHETEHAAETDDVLLGYRVGASSWSWCVDGASRSDGVESPLDIIGMYHETRIINGFEVPVPETKEPKRGDDFYLATTIGEDLYRLETWTEHHIDELWLKRGLVFLNKEDAIATAKAMLGVDPHS